MHWSLKVHKVSLTLTRYREHCRTSQSFPLDCFLCVAVLIIYKELLMGNLDHIVDVRNFITLVSSFQSYS